jgi:hypothetical protein
LFTLSGLALALKSTYNLHLTAKTHSIDFDSIRYYYDVRLANILVDKNCFVLSNFGLGVLKLAKEESATLWKSGCRDYIALKYINVFKEQQQVKRGVDV